jgi:hypothetical protein
MRLRIARKISLTRIAPAVLVGLLVGGGCDGGRPVRPSATPAPPLSAGATCASGCALIADAAPLRVASYRADSADVPIHIATLRVHGAAGESIALVLRADSAVLEATRDARLVMRTDEGEEVLSLTALLSGKTVYRFRRDETITIRYELTPRVRFDPSGAISLVVHSSALIESAHTPWIRTPMSERGVLYDATGGDCSLNAASGDCGFTTYTISPYMPGVAFPGFQNAQGTGVSSPITVTFNPPVGSATITAHDPTWAGNQAIAYDANGAQVGSVSFAFTDEPGNNVPDTKSLTGNIARVQLIPADGEYITWEMTVTPGETNQVTLNIIKAEGPNAEKSFTLQERTITLAASVVPPELGPEVTWDVVDDPGDQVATKPPTNVNPGLETSFSVPPQDIGRWNAYDHPGALSQKSLAFKVTASVVRDGQTFRSEPVIVKQDEIDTAREEYIELKLHRVPARGAFKSVPMRRIGLNAGDYGFALLNERFMGMLGTLEQDWKSLKPASTWQVNVVYRSPVHNRRHANRQEISSGAVPNSWHQYGCAADLQTFPAPRETPDDVKKAEDFWLELATTAVEMGFDIEPMIAPKGRPSSGVGHVHVELDCP